MTMPLPAAGTPSFARKGSEEHITPIRGLWENRFYTHLNEITDSIEGMLMEAIEFCRREEAKGGEFAKDARHSMEAYIDALAILYPDVYKDHFG